MAKTVLSESFLEKMASQKTCDAGDFEIFVAEAAKRSIPRKEASKLFAHWRGYRVLREHMLDSATWQVTEHEIKYNSTGTGRAMTAFYR